MPKRCDLRIEQKLKALHVLRVVCELCIEHSLDSPRQQRWVMARP
jgi:hypothetical protein